MLTIDELRAMATEKAEQNKLYQKQKEEDTRVQFEKEVEQHAEKQYASFLSKCERAIEWEARNGRFETLLSYDVLGNLYCATPTFIQGSVIAIKLLQQHFAELGFISEYQDRGLVDVEGLRCHYHNLRINWS